MKFFPEKVLSSFYGLLAVAMVLVSGCATTSELAFTSDPVIEPASSSGRNPTNPPPFTSDGGEVFKLGNVVIVTFSDTPDIIPPHEEPIKEDGKITLPLIGSVKAVGKLAGELQKEIHDLYVPKYYVRLNVTVKPVPTDRLYSVLGEVRQPGPKPYAGMTTVTKAIGAAGGLTDFASKRKIMLIRSNGTKLKVNYNDAISDPKKDPQVFPGDSINVEKTWL